MFPVTSVEFVVEAIVLLVQSVVCVVHISVLKYKYDRVEHTQFNN